MNTAVFVERIKLAESSMRGVTAGSIGLCPCCYRIGKITRHHVHPQSVEKTTLAAEHRTLADVVTAVRRIRFPEALTPATEP